MNRRIIKFLMIVLISVLLTSLTVGCGNTQPKVITNTDNEPNVGVEQENGSSEKLTPVIPNESEDEEGTEKNNDNNSDSDNDNNDNSDSNSGNNRNNNASSNDDSRNSNSNDDNKYGSSSSVENSNNSGDDDQKTGVENSSVNETEESKENLAEGADTDEQQAEQQDEENSDDATANDGTNEVIIDGVKYVGYKGPVQGEIKYAEGTPATTNSSEYKASGDIQSPYHTNLVVTTDFGQSKIFAENVGLVRDEVAMEVLFRNLDIITAYGGGFVNSINGIESQYTFYTGADRKKVDWFYWVNGILASVGVGEYKLQDGDIMWWDYHNWGSSMFVNAVIGSYPQPFKSGYNGYNPGTVIMYTEAYEQEAESLKSSLVKQGVKQVDITSYDPSLLKNPEKYYILLGVWDDLVKDNEGLYDVNRKNKLVGLYAEFEDGKLNALDYKGKVISAHEQGGAIYAYAPGMGGSNPIWVVTGTDETGFKMAYDLLLNNPESINLKFAVVVSKNGLKNVPYID